MKWIFKLGSIALRLRLQRIHKIGKAIISRALSLKGEVVFSFDGLTIGGDPRLHLSYLYALYHGWEKFSIQLFKESVKQGQVVLDLGAHIGTYTLLAAKLVGPAGKVYAFEPDPRNYKWLIRNIQRNGFSDRVFPVEKAIGAQSGGSKFLLADDSFSSSLFAHEWIEGKHREIEVQTVSLNEVLDTYIAHRIRVIKMDIEGAEILALKGIKWIIEQGNPHLVIFVECNPATLKAVGSSPEELVKRIKGLGFTVRIIDEDHERLLDIEDDVVVSLQPFAERSFNFYCKYYAKQNVEGIKDEDVFCP